MKKSIEELVTESKESSFNMHSYDVSIRFENFISNMMLYTNYDKFENNEILTPSEWLNGATPGFQRDNDKWDEDMQIRFIENILNGCDTQIKLFRFDEYDDAMIIDGLQRSTAICEFFNGNIKPFRYSYSELKDKLHNFGAKIQIKIYNFSSWEKVGKFYIDMNDRITHSQKDIDKAKKWFLEEKNIKL